MTAKCSWASVITWSMRLSSERNQSRMHSVRYLYSLQCTSPQLLVRFWCQWSAIMPLFLLVLFSLVVPHSFGKRSDGEVCQSKINGMSTRMDRLEKDKQDLQLKIEHQQENFERRLEELEKRQILGNDGKGIDITKRLLAPIGSVDSG